MVQTALISVSDKSGLVDFATRLSELGIDLVSTGNTAAHLRDAGLNVRSVADWTGFPEILDGRVKTLHPAIHGGILANRDSTAHLEKLDVCDIDTIDLVVCNFYPVDGDADQIDIGGPAMVRAAAKNHAHVTAVVDPGDYDAVADAVAGNTLDEEMRRRLALKAFRHTAAYDRAIIASFESGEEMPEHLPVELRQIQPLRYGENPHQRAALYRRVAGDETTRTEKLHGKELSYNNLVDLDAALQLVWEFDAPCAAVIKHTNPAGCAEGDSIEAAFERALAGDPMSAFGGIVALNRVLTLEVAEAIDDVFIEVVAAPDFEDEALDVLTQKKNIRLMRISTPGLPAHQFRSTSLGWLVQSADPKTSTALADLQIPTVQKPNDRQFDDLTLAWRVVKHVKSNAIVLVKDRQVIGVGAGQMSRIDAVKIAVRKCVANSPRGAVLASDAFFPFRDGLDVAAEAGITAVVQPGGSRRDGEVIKACDEHDVAMVMTGQRHFRHG